MHDCQRFREDWVVGEAEDFGDCADCRSFCEDAGLILQATDGAAQPMPELSEFYWDGFESRLHTKLVRERSPRASRVDYWKWSATLATAAALTVVVSWGPLRENLFPGGAAETTREIEFTDEHIEGLNPSVVEFLGQSELFLRNFTKIDAQTDSSYQDDLEYAQSRARRGLEEIAQQKQRAADFVPVRIALEEYEGVLRDIKNLESTDELKDIQSRIRRNGLIANMKAYQPQVMLVSQRD